nr:hypothetical protein GCM10025699_25290 [Microbacterium flavescens]
MRAAQRTAVAGIAFVAVLSLGGTSGAWADAAAPPSSTGSVTVEPAAEGDLAAAAERRVEAMSTREQAASVVMGHIPTTDPAALRTYMESTGIGGFILMGANVPGDEAALRDVTAALSIDPAFPPVVSIDQEGGDVSRLPWDGFRSSVDLKSDEPAAAERAFAGRGRSSDAPASASTSGSSRMRPTTRRRSSSAGRSAPRRPPPPSEWPPRSPASAAGRCRRSSISPGTAPHRATPIAASRRPA